MRRTIIKSLGSNPRKKEEIFLRLVLNKKIRSVIRKIKTDFDIPENEKMTKKKFINLMENPKLINKAKEIIETFDLPNTWEDIVLEYIITDNFVHDKDPDGLSLETRTGEIESEKEFYLRIFSNTSIKDINDVWFLVQKEINPNNKHKAKKKKYKKFKRNVEIYFLHKEGKKDSDILRIIKEKFPEEKELDPGNIKVVISNFKKLEEGKK